MNRALSVLSISYDESLLRTREWILKSAGFNVTSAFAFTEARALCRNSGFDLVIIGHSLPQADQAALIGEIRTHNHSRTLYLRRQGEEPMAGVDHSADPLSAEALLEAVRTALEKSEDSEAKPLT